MAVTFRRVRAKRQIKKNGYIKYLKRKHDYIKCSWCNNTIGKDANFCSRCGNRLK